MVEEKGLVYCYLTRSESYGHYRLETESTFGKELSFFWDSEGDWQRFVKKVMKINKWDTTDYVTFLGLV